MRYYSVATLWLAITLALMGCGGDSRLGINGEVTLKGAPLDEGVITFYPQAGGSQAGDIVRKGKYQIGRDKGLLPGKYRVTISSPDGRTPNDGGDALPGPTGNFASKDRIPPEYNTESKQEVEVKASGPNKFDFHIK